MTPDPKPTPPTLLDPGADRAPRRRLLQGGVALLAGAALGPLLGGCAALQAVDVEVTTFGAWPAGRAPGRYAFDRLPSQVQGGTPQELLEASASVALDRVGFSQAADPAQADVLVQFGARGGKVIDPPPPLSFMFGLGRSFGGLGGRRGGFYGGSSYYERNVRDFRELSLLLLDRSSHQVLVEVQARHESTYTGDDLLTAMFDATLQGFPDLPTGARRVTVALPSAATR
ncbi:MAG: DUF4136 domain-containing protein [Leptothrix sp. (in: b-proteobacteria)]